MSAAKTGGYLLALTVIGLVAFAVFGAVYQAGVGQPLSETPTSSANISPAALLLTGTRSALDQSAQAAQQGRRGEATHALDAALRALETGAFALDEQTRKPWEEALKEAKQAKTALQNGAGERLPEYARAASDRLGLAPTPEAVAVTGAAALDQYAGATLLNAAGIRIGEVRQVTPENDSVELVIGGVRNLFGFLDWGGRAVRVPAQRLLFGPAAWPRPVMVVAPTLESRPEAILNRLQ